MTHKILIWVLIVFFLSSCNKNEKFVGMIKYKLSYKVLPYSLSHIEQLKYTFGDSCDLLYDGKNVEWKMLNAKLLKSITYSSKDNILYNFTYKSDSIMYVDCSEKDEIIQSYKILKNQDTILNHPCDLLILDSKLVDSSFVGIKRIKYYYFTHDIVIDTTIFSKYFYNSQNFMAKNTGGVILKMIDSFNNFSITYEATEIVKNKDIRILTNFDKRLLTKKK